MPFVYIDGSAYCGKPNMSRTPAVCSHPYLAQGDDKDEGGDSYTSRLVNAIIRNVHVKVMTNLEKNTTATYVRLQ